MAPYEIVLLVVAGIVVAAALCWAAAVLATHIARHHAPRGKSVGRRPGAP